MKEIQVGDILFKVKDFLPYTELDKLNLFGIYSLQLKIQKYQSSLPKKKDDENNEEFMKRITDELKEGTITFSQEVMDALLDIGNQTKLFDRHVDELLIQSPKLIDCRPTVIIKLKRTPEYIRILANVKEDLEALMNPDKKEPTNIPKKE